MPDVRIQVFSYSFRYDYEYVGASGTAATVWSPALERGIFALLMAYRQLQLPLLQGPEGKIHLVREVAERILGRPLMVRAMVKHFGTDTLEEASLIEFSGRGALN